MIVFFESGRLGNQLLQYAVLRHHFPRHRICFFGLQALRSGFNCVRTRFLPHAGAWQRPVGLLRRLLGTLARLRLISEAFEHRQGERCTLAKRRGLLPGLVLVRPAYFQHADFEACVPPGLAIAPAVRDEAGRFVAAHCAPGDTPVFVHLRRGDYLAFPSPAAAAALPDRWFLGAMAALQQALPRPRFFVCSDDLAHARHLMAGRDDVVFCDRGELGDLAVMACCRGGVMSPSTFSWWGGFFARRALQARAGEGVFIAPEFWVGHRTGQWYPAGFRFPWIRYL